MQVDINRMAAVIILVTLLMPFGSGLQKARRDFAGNVKP